MQYEAGGSLLEGNLWCQGNENGFGGWIYKTSMVIVQRTPPCMLKFIA